MHQCIWKGTPIIGTYGGRETILPTPRTCSKIVFLIGFKESEKMNFSVNSLDYNKSKVLMNSHISGNPYRRDYLSCLTNKDSKPI